jgi:ion channel
VTRGPLIEGRRAIAAVVRAETITHRHLRDRLTVLASLTAVADVIGTLLMWLFERNSGSDIKDLWDAFFFATTQLLTVSSNIAAPATAGGRLVDIVLEALAITVVAVVAGSFASFFHLRTQERRADEAP